MGQIDIFHINNDTYQKNLKKYELTHDIQLTLSVLH